MTNTFRFENLKESVQLEGKKAEKTLPKSLWETYSSFCNTLGGTIVLGVDEDEEGNLIPIGVTDSNALMKDLWSGLNNKQKVSINLLTESDIELITVEDKVVILIHVPIAPRESKPVFINNNIISGTYRRNNDGDYHCTQLEINNMLRDQNEKTQDYRMVDSYNLQQINPTTFASYRKQFDELHRNHSWSTLDDEEFLYRISGMDKDRDGQYHLTQAGLFMFGNDYEIEKEFPNYFIDYQEHLDSSTRWSNRIHSGEGNWSGNLFDFFFTIMPLLSSAFGKPFSLDQKGRRQEEHKGTYAIREALLNCICNANFYDSFGLVIKRYPDKLEFANPGILRVPIEKAIEGGYSDPRNKAIMKMFSLIGYGERAGSGIPEIFAIWKEYHWPKPQIIQEFNHDRTILRLSLGIKIDDEMIQHPSYRAIYEYMQEHPCVKTKEIATLLHVKEAWARQILKEMIDKDYILALGSNRNRSYELKYK